LALAMRELEITWGLLVLAPFLFAAATWALQMACAFCAVEPPPYWHSALIVIAVAVANVTLNYFLFVTDTHRGFWMEYLAPVLASGVVVALTIPTPLVSAIGVAAMHLLFCGVLCFGLEGLIEIVARSAAAAF
jgi:hypothetical protein